MVVVVVMRVAVVVMVMVMVVVVAAAAGLVGRHRSRRRHGTRERESLLTSHRLNLLFFLVVDRARAQRRARRALGSMLSTKGRPVVYQRARASPAGIGAQSSSCVGRGGPEERERGGEGGGCEAFALV
jgi:hypothetical protein